MAKVTKPDVDGFIRLGPTGDRYEVDLTVSSLDVDTEPLADGGRKYRGRGLVINFDREGQDYGKNFPVRIELSDADAMRFVADILNVLAPRNIHFGNTERKGEKLL